MTKTTLKKQNGVTLLALTVYILVFTIIIGIITTISSFFYRNIGTAASTPKYAYEFNKFTMFFVTDIKNFNTAEVTSNTIQFSDDIKYEYKDNCIYRNDVVIANNIMNCSFTLSNYNANGKNKTICNVNMEIGKNEETLIQKNVDFTLKYW